jgi:hypothetical protein
MLHLAYVTSLRRIGGALIAGETCEALPCKRLYPQLPPSKIFALLLKNR